jgi:DNA invertase Pin-like site-specific DNA recombinase
MKAKRAALYLRVSTGEQTTENQRHALMAAAEQRGWQVVKVHEDKGVSGATGRDKRPGLDDLLSDATRGRFDVAMVWSVDLIGRSLPDLVNSLHELHGAKVDLFLHQQAVDTTTPSGRAMFGMLSVFAEFERAMICARVNAGLARAKQEGTRSGKPIGRPKVPAATEAAIRERLTAGAGMLRVAREVGVGCGTVQRIKGEMAAAAAT